MTKLDIFADIEFDTQGESTPQIEPVKSSFDGLMEEVSLADVIQLACLESRSRKLLVYSDDETGEIYFKNGEIVHAITKNLVGENAFYEILSWEEGSFRFLKGISEKKTIDVPWNFLLIEALRQKDEKKAKVLNQKSTFQPRIIIVDDSKFFTSRLRQLFKEEINARVIGEAQNGKEALELLSSNPPDLITLDINMPIMTGDVALKHIMIRSPAPVVLISNFNERNTSKVMEFLRLGAVDFISKPSDPSSWSYFSKRLKSIANCVSLLKVKNIRRARNPKKVSEKILPGIPADRLLVFLGGLGGLLEIQKILPNLNLSSKDGILILQDMCKSFLVPFSNYMGELCPFSIKFLDKGAPILSGQGWVLNTDEPYKVLSDESGAGLFIKENGENQEEVERFFKKLAEIYRQDLIVVVLSGTKKEFLSSLYEVYSKVGIVICQAPDTCLFPEPLKDFVALDLATEVLAPEEIARRINEIIETGR